MTKVKFYSTRETLDKVLELVEKNQKGGYFRFGDGDVNLALGMSELLQNAENELTKLMVDSMKLNHPNVIRTLPLHCKEWGTLEEGMFPGNHECPLDWCENIFNNFTNITGEEDQIELYSNVALSHLSLKDPDYASSFLNTISSKVKYFIGNENIPKEILEKLFGPKVIHIKTPSKASFSKFNQIYQQFQESCLGDQDYSVVITSMGCTGRVMQKKIWDNYDNFFLFDFGSLMDALCGWNTRAWMDLVKFDSENFLNKIK